MSPKFTKKPAKKNHKSQSKKTPKAASVQETAPVETPLEEVQEVEPEVPEVVQETAPVKKTTTKKSAKKAATEEVQETEPVKKTTPKKSAAPKKVAAPKKESVPKKEAAPKKAAAKKVSPKTQKGGDVEVDVEAAEKEKTIRSFKVQLPGNEDYTGRFTGWTPYQAANKALSRYFRSTTEPQPVVTFSIRESTRGSHHKIYTYEGMRVKLEKPVKYTIGGEGGEEIVKRHKNQLKKVKKADLTTNEEL